MKKKIFLYLLPVLIFSICHTAGARESDYTPGEVTAYKFTDSEIYSGTERTVWIYVPAAYTGEQPACLYVALDGIPFDDTATLDRLISAGEIPVMIGVFVSSGTVTDDKGAVRFNRSNEFDTRSGEFARFLETELLPWVETLTANDGRPIKLSANPDDRMIHGNSSGAICAFTAAWMRPDLFRRVYSAIGTYVSMRGGNEYPAIIRKSEPKPIRMFLQDTYDDVWNPLFGSWFEANVLMESALRFAGYDMKHEWGEGAHDGHHASAIFPDVLRWLWRDWPAPVGKGTSQNDMLAAILEPASDWTFTGEAEKELFSDKSGKYGPESSVALFPDGRMLAVKEAGSHWIYNYIVDPDGTLRDGRRWYWLHNTPNSEAEPIGNMMFDVAGNLYVATTDGVQVCDHNGRVRAILTPPPGAVSSLRFGGDDMKTLYVVSGGRLYERRVKIAGFSGDGNTHEVPTQGAG